VALIDLKFSNLPRIVSLLCHLIFLGEISFLESACLLLSFYMKAIDVWGKFRRQWMEIRWNLGFIIIAFITFFIVILLAKLVEWELL